MNPLPFPVIRKVVEDELLGGLPLTEVFESFDERPLGSASIAQVHRARLRGGREVAVKVQRPNVERRLMSDIGVIKQFSMVTREIFPVDYYLVCSELEEQLQDEFNFMAEANGMDRIADALDRNRRRPPVQVPRSIPGLTSKRVLCMDFIPGAPLSQLREELKRRGIEIEPGSLAEQAGKWAAGYLGELGDDFRISFTRDAGLFADVPARYLGEISFLHSQKPLGSWCLRRGSSMPTHILATSSSGIWVHCQMSRRSYHEPDLLGLVCWWGCLRGRTVR